LFIVTFFVVVPFTGVYTIQIYFNVSIFLLLISPYPANVENKVSF